MSTLSLGVSQVSHPVLPRCASLVIRSFNRFLSEAKLYEPACQRMQRDVSGVAAYVDMREKACQREVLGMLVYKRLTRFDPDSPGISSG